MYKSKFALHQGMALLVPILTAWYAQADCVDRGFNNLENQVLNSYIAYYGRPADPAGLAYWAKRLDDEGGDLSSIINAFGVSAEFDARFGDLTPEDLITNLYQQLFNRDPEQGGFDYWLDQYTSGARTLQNIALALLDGAQNEDLEIVTNRNLVARHFVSQSECAGIELPESTYNSLLDSVNEQSSSTAVACDLVDDSIESQGGACAHDTWVRKSDMLETGSAMSTCAIGGKLYAVGVGHVPVGQPNRADVYDPATDSWTPIADMPTGTRYGSASAVNGKCYAIGGIASGFSSVDIFQEYDPATDSWRVLSPLPSGRSGHASAVIDDKIYVVGGGPERTWRTAGTAAVHIYDPATNQWSVGADMPTPRGAVAAGAIDGYIYVVGGSNVNMAYSNLVHRYDPATDSWTRRADLPVNVDYASATVHDGELYVFGGFDENNGPEALQTDDTTAAAFRYDPIEDHWTRLSDMSQKRYATGSETLNGKIYVIGGRPQRQLVDDLSVVEEYTP